jgi:hypothetical protein
VFFRGARRVADVCLIGGRDGNGGLGGGCDHACVVFEKMPPPRTCPDGMQKRSLRAGSRTMVYLGAGMELFVLIADFSRDELR